MIPPTFYWHDYETWGTDPRRDRAAQFAGLRTDLELNVIGSPLVVYCRPADDLLPQPEACLVTGLTPQHCETKGRCEADFISAIHGELSRPGTCGVGYNNIRFDDEVTRFTLYRNLYDPYAREWKNGNSRWDIIDMVRLTRALRPEGIHWPQREDGAPDFRLEALTEANGIVHGAAHDALSDVEATIALARLIRTRQRRLYDYVFEHRGKSAAARLLDFGRRTPVLHVSGMYPARLGSIAPVVPLARHPTNGNGILVYDLRHDPTPLLQADAKEIHRLVFTASEDLAEGESRIPLKTVHLNKCPVLVPMKTLTPEAAERWQIDPAGVKAHARALRQAKGLERRIQKALTRPEFAPEPDPELDLYGGGFFSDADRARMEEIHRLSPAELAAYRPGFEDRRLPELLFRYRARNWPESLSPEERQRWEHYRRRRLTDPEGGGSLTLMQYEERLQRLRQERARDGRATEILRQLDAWRDRLVTW